MKPKGAVRNASSVEAALPRSLDELARIAGGPFALIEQAEQQAGTRKPASGSTCWNTMSRRPWPRGSRGTI